MKHTKTVKTSVVELINEYSNIMLITHPDDQMSALKEFFNEDMTEVKDNEKWDDLTVEQRSLVILSFEESILRVSAVIEDENSTPKLKLVKD